MKVKRNLAGLAVLSMASLLAACGAPATSSSGKGAEVAVALAPDSTPNWFFPIESAATYNDLNTQVSYMMYEPLIYINRHDQVDFHRSLASSIAESHNDTVFTIHLGDRYHWSNGRPVTAQDVVFTWDTMNWSSSNAKDLPWTYGGEGFGGVASLYKSVVAQGPHTVVVTLTKPTNPQWFILNSLNQIVPAPAFVWDQYPNNPVKELSFIEKEANTPGSRYYQVVDGPYKLSSMVPNQKWAFVPNPHYGGTHSQVAKVIYEYETSTQAEFTQLKQGAISFGFLPFSMWSARKQLQSDVMTPTFLWGFNDLELNFSPQAPGGLGPVFSQLYVRQALEEGVNQTGIINTFYHRLGLPETDPVLNKPSTPFFNPALKNPIYPYNPAQGKALLIKHGWHLTNGVMTKNGVALSFVLDYASGDPTYADIVQLLKQSWAQEGINVSLKSEPIANVITQTEGTDWSMALDAVGTTVSWTYEPDYFPSGGGLFGSWGGQNVGHYNNADMNAVLNSLYRPMSAQESTHDLYAYESLAQRQLPDLWIPYPPILFETSKNLKGVMSSFDPISDLYYPNHWTVTP